MNTYIEFTVRPRITYKGILEVPRDSVDEDDIDENFIISHWDNIEWDKTYGDLYGYKTEPDENPYDCDVVIDDIYQE